MEDNEEPPTPIIGAPAPHAVQRPPWVLSHDEQRALIITFIGGLASIIAGACVIGGAIAMARSMKASHAPLSDQIYWTAAIGLITAFVVFLRRHFPKVSKEIFGRFDWVVILVCFYVPFAMFLLAWIGL